LNITFLGTGTSQGIPVIGCGCKVCHSSDQRDNRLLVQNVSKNKNVLNTILNPYTPKNVFSNILNPFGYKYFCPVTENYLLQENEAYILLENNGKIIL
jgi:hypothetical protein